MRPGRPFAFGPLYAGGPRHPTKTAWLFALPGNPVAALVTFYVFAREALLTLAGATPTPLPTLQARSPLAIRKRPGRTEFQRARVSLAADGQWEVQTTGSQGAGILRSMSEANALLVLRHEQGFGGSRRSGGRVAVRRARLTRLGRPRRRRGGCPAHCLVFAARVASLVCSHIPTPRAAAI